MPSSRTFPCLLGPLELSGLEVPSVFERIGTQRTIVHRLIGGGRIVQSFGPDPGRRVLRGIFSGPDAIERAQLLEVIRDLGEPLELTIGAWTELVVLTKAVLSYQSRGVLIPYLVEAETIFSPVLAVEAGLSELVGGVIASLGLSGSTLSGIAPAAGGAVASAISVAGTGITAILATDLTTDAGRAGGQAALAGVMGGVSLAIASSGQSLAGIAQAGGGSLVADSGSLSQAASISASHAGLVQAAGTLNQAASGLSGLEGGLPVATLHS